MLSISIVSHGQKDLLLCVLSDITKYCDVSALEVILTFNLLGESIDLDDWDFPMKVIQNLEPKGFAANHNQAFELAEGDFFCVLNPDVRFNCDPFSPLLQALDDSKVGLAAPLVVNNQGGLEDSVRYFPRPLEIVGKLFGQASARHVVSSGITVFPDWVAGMMMVFPDKVFSKLNGFDSSYFLYYEDVDICARLKLEGYKVVVCQDTSVVHEAQRTSHKSFKYLKWHFLSMLQFFLSPVYRQIRTELSKDRT